MANSSHLSTGDIIHNRKPTKEDANGFGLVQYFRSDFQAWYFGYWDDRRAHHDGWTHCINYTPKRSTH